MINKKDSLMEAKMIKVKVVVLRIKMLIVKLML